MTNHARCIRSALLLLAGAVLTLFPNNDQLLSAAPILQFNSGSGFIGAWCAQGDQNKRASISDKGGGFLTLTNENGDSAVGNVTGSNTVSAPQWQFVTGTLSGDGRTINWSNGTYWARCRGGSGGGGGGGGGYRPPTQVSLNGKWYPNGNRSLSCTIQQRHGNLSLTNEVGQSASGSFDSKRKITTNWDGNVIHGTVSSDGNRIDWDNGTYWIRFRVY